MARWRGVDDFLDAGAGMTAAGDEPESVPVERARAGIRAWVRAAGRRAGEGLWSATPYGIVALLAASAVAPIAGVALGATGEFAAALGQLGGVGSNYLSDSLYATARRMRGSEPTIDEWRDAVAGELLARLESGDERAIALRDELGALLHAVDAVDVALRAADERTQQALAMAFGALGEDVGLLHHLASDAARVLAALQQQLAEQGRVQSVHTDLLRQSLVVTAQLRQDLLRRLPSTPGPAHPADDEPAGQVGAAGRSAAPYPGLASFQATDARYFHGRETLVAELLGRLSEQLVGGPPLVVVGVSGVGKSSLLRAGVLPAIATGGLGPGSGDWPWLIMTPGAAPLAELTGRTAALAGADPAASLAAVRDAPAAFGDLAARASAGSAAVGESPAGADPAASLAAVRDAPAAFGDLAAETGAGPASVGESPAGSDPEPSVSEYAGRGGGRLVIVVDQFEELFTQCADPAERTAFVEALAAAAPALVLIAVRADFYPQCTELAPMVPMLGAGQVVVGPLRTDELRRAVHEPAHDAGLVLQPGLEELLLADLGARSGPADESRPVYEPGALPLLAHALRAIWARRAGDTMTVAGYRETGGIRHAVAETAERIYLDLGADERVALRSALLSLVTVVDNLTVRRRATHDEADVAVLGPMIGARLVTAGQDTVEISHEALLTGWPRLAGWLTEAREEILLRQRLAQAAADWSAAAEDPDLLYRGGRLATSREWAAGRTDVPEPQRRFLAAGEAAAGAELLAQRRSTRRLRRLVAGLAVLLLLAVGGGVVALVQRRAAQSNAREAQSKAREVNSRQLAARSRVELFTDESGAVRHALDAWAAAHTFEARSALLSAELTITQGPLGTEQRAYAVAVSPDGRLVAVGYYDGRIQLWDSGTLRKVEELKHPTTRMISLRFSPYGRFLAAGAINLDGVAIWDVPSRRLIRRLPAFGAVAWLPDSSAVLASWTKGQPAGQIVGAWNPRDGRQTDTLPTAIPAAISMSISGDGAYLALAGAAGGQLLRRADQRSLATWPGDASKSVVFARDGTLVSADLDGRITRWDVPSGRQLRVLTRPDDPAAPTRLAITPDGTVLAQDDQRGSILRLTLDGGVRTSLTQFPGLAQDMSLSADGRLLAVVGIDSPPMLFRLGVDRLPHPQPANFLAFDPTGRRLATGSTDPVIRIWDPRTSALTSTIQAQGDRGPIGLAYAPDGALAATFGDGTVQLFDPDGKPRRVLRADKGFIATEPVFSPDGSLLAALVNTTDVLKRTEINGRPGVTDVMIWDVRTLNPRARLETTGYGTEAAAFTPDGAHLIVAANRSRVGSDPNDDHLAGTGPAQDGAVWQWRTSDLRQEARQDLPNLTLNDLAVSPDSRQIAVATGDREAHLLRVDGLTPAGTIAEHRFGLDKVAFSPDGRLLATTSQVENDFVRLWDTRSGDLLAEPRGMGPVFPVQFSPDSTTLAVGSSDWTVGLWHVDPDDAVRRLCARFLPIVRAEGSEVPELCRAPG